MAKVMDAVFARCQGFRAAGQKEYAHENTNAFRNFESVGAYTGISREACLLVYMLKHVDGISAYVKGHKSQREDVRGRICDAIVYLCLLYGMVEENEAPDNESAHLKALIANERAARGTPYS